jgi:SAM-dependent methyltransferase
VKRTKCSACGYDDLRVFLDLGASPIADAYTAQAGDVTGYHPLQLAVCTGCWLVQLLEVVDQRTLFGTGYSFYSSASAPLSAYHEDYAKWILKSDYADCAHRLVVELGCNDGDMLRHFHTEGCPTLGVDPASGPVAAARERGLEVVEKPFTATRARELVGSHGHAGVIIANHVLAHVEDVSDFLEGVSNLLAGSGVAFVEVQYLPDLLVSNAFDLVYHEHRNFFSLTSLKRAALRWGLHVVGVRLTERQSGSLRVTLRHARSELNRVQHVEDSEEWLRHESTYHGFQGRVERVRQRLNDLVYAEREAGRIVIGYGAPAKATTLLNFCDLGSNALSHVVDTTVAKQGRFIPGTGLEIRAPRELYASVAARTTYLLLAWNYAQHITRSERSFTDNGGRWVVPIPVPTAIGG